MGGALQVPPVHPCAPQLRPHCPQLLASVASTASHPFATRPSQLPKPALHVSPQDVPLQLAVALAPPGQAMQELPHVAGSVLLAHAFPQA